jgi:hypothetical protein
MKQQCGFILLPMIIILSILALLVLEEESSVILYQKAMTSEQSRAHEDIRAISSKFKKSTSAK